MRRILPQHCLPRCPLPIHRVQTRSYAHYPFAEKFCLPSTQRITELFANDHAAGKLNKSGHLAYWADNSLTMTDLVVSIDHALEKIYNKNSEHTPNTQMILHRNRILKALLDEDPEAYMIFRMANLPLILDLDETSITFRDKEWGLVTIMQSHTKPFDDIPLYDSTHHQAIIAQLNGHRYKLTKKWMQILVYGRFIGEWDELKYPFQKELTGVCHAVPNVKKLIKDWGKEALILDEDDDYHPIAP